MATQCDVLVDGQRIPDADVLGFVVDLDLDQRGTCTVTLSNACQEQNDRFRLGAAIELKVGLGESGAAGTLFKGELVGIEPSYRRGGESELSLRAFDRVHRLQRARKSKTYQDQSDQDIASAIATQHGLSAQCGSDPRIVHKQVYQHNQTDLEFLRLRAGRLGFSVWCEDTKLFFDAPKLDADSGLRFVRGGDGQGKATLVSFNARMSNLLVVKKMVVRGWNPETNKEIVGEASAQRSPLGSRIAASSLGNLDSVTTYTVDHPIFSVDEANAIAKAKLEELSMSFLTVEAEAMGHNKVKPGIVVNITVNEAAPTDRFNGRYLVRGCTHRFAAGSGGYTTSMRLARDAEGS